MTNTKTNNAISTMVSSSSSAIAMGALLLLATNQQASVVTASSSGGVQCDVRIHGGWKSCSDWNVKVGGSDSLYCESASDCKTVLIHNGSSKVSVIENIDLGYNDFTPVVNTDGDEYVPTEEEAQVEEEDATTLTQTAALISGGDIPEGLDCVVTPPSDGSSKKYVSCYDMNVDVDGSDGLFCTTQDECETALIKNGSSQKSYQHFAIDRTGFTPVVNEYGDEYVPSSSDEDEKQEELEEVAEASASTVETSPTKEGEKDEEVVDCVVIPPEGDDNSYYVNCYDLVHTDSSLRQGSLSDDALYCATRKQCETVLIERGSSQMSYQTIEIDKNDWVPVVNEYGDEYVPTSEDEEETSLENMVVDSAAAASSEFQKEEGAVSNDDVDCVLKLPRDSISNKKYASCYDMNVDKEGSDRIYCTTQRECEIVFNKVSSETTTSYSSIEVDRSNFTPVVNTYGDEYVPPSTSKDGQQEDSDVEEGEIAFASGLLEEEEEIAPPKEEDHHVGANIHYQYVDYSHNDWKPVVNEYGDEYVPPSGEEEEQPQVVVAAASFAGLLKEEEEAGEEDHTNDDTASHNNNVGANVHYQYVDYSHNDWKPVVNEYGDEYVPPSEEDEGEEEEPVEVVFASGTIDRGGNNTDDDLFTNETLSLMLDDVLSSNTTTDDAYEEMLEDEEEEESEDINVGSSFVRKEDKSSDNKKSIREEEDNYINNVVTSAEILPDSSSSSSFTTTAAAATAVVMTTMMAVAATTTSMMF